jgi:glycosyltransferase involved in cell wall biosynthesis
MYPRRLLNGIVLGRKILEKRNESGQNTPLYPIIAPTLIRALREFRPDVVISVNLGVWTLMSIMAGYRTIIYWEGTAHTERTIRKARLSLRRWMARRAMAFVVNGKQSRDYVMNALGVSGDAIFEGGLGPELPPSDLAVSLDKPERSGPVRFLFAGRLIPLKGVPHLLYAAKILLDRGYAESNFQITVLGDGPERASLERLASDLGLGRMVHFVGGVDPLEVWKFYYASDVFVLPTLQDNWPLVIAEAMSLGKAIIASNCAGSVSDLIKIGENGFSFDPTDNVELARLMSFYIDHPETIVSHGRHSREIAANYTPVKVAQPYIRAVNVTWERCQYKEITP